MHVRPVPSVLVAMLSLGCVGASGPPGAPPRPPPIERTALPTEGTAPSALRAPVAAPGPIVPSTALPTKPEQPFVGRKLYVDPESDAKTQGELWRRTGQPGAEAMDSLAEVPLALWIGDWTLDPQREVDGALTKAEGQLRVVVVYDIPHRDCGSHSAGGAPSGKAYEKFVADTAAGIAGRLVIVILEPDALALDDCLGEADRTERSQLLASAVDTLSAAGAAVYLDAGDSNWIPAEKMAERLASAGVARAAGFALNVAHTEFTRNEIAYAEALRAVLGPDAHYVIDTGRNGAGPSPDNAWCNPPGRKNGQRPTLETHVPGLDALLWIKKPGHSDGRCNGGPAAGRWWPEYALELAQ